MTAFGTCPFGRRTNAGSFVIEYLEISALAESEDESILSGVSNTIPLEFEYEVSPLCRESTELQMSQFGARISICEKPETVMFEEVDAFSVT